MQMYFDIQLCVSQCTVILLTHLLEETMSYDDLDMP